MKNLGIIGGLGPMATVYFMELIIRMTDVKSDQEHMRIYLQSLPDTPDEQHTYAVKVRIVHYRFY